jgi:SulP family sulfate permease
MNFKAIFPLYNDLNNYNRSKLKGDMSAGITIGVLLIPQGMAYSMLAGLPPIYGLYAATVPLIIYSIFGTSRQLGVGPVAMVALLIAAGVSALATPGSSEFISLAILLALMVGIIQTAMGIFRLGFLVNFLSQPVISGFTSAAALIIGLSQLKHLFAINLPRSNYIHQVLYNALERINEVHLPSLILGLVGIAIIIFVKKISKTIPGSLVALVLSILTVYIFNLQNHGIEIAKNIPSGLPTMSLPNFEWSQVKALIPISLTISLIGFMQSIAVAKAIQIKHKTYKVIPNTELIALGLANIGGSLFQSFPITGGFSRTAVNNQAGAKTGVATIISALLIMLTLLFLTPLFYYLPKAILASVIMVAVFGLIEFKEAKHLWKTDRADFYMLLAAFIGTLFIGIEEGIIIGVALSIGMIVYRTMKPHIAVVGRIKGTDTYRNLNRFKNAEDRDDAIIVRFDARIYFANANYFKEKVEILFDQKAKTLKLFALEAQSINAIDSSGVKMLFEIYSDCKERNIEMVIIGLNGPVRDSLYKAGFVQTLNTNHFFNNTQQAIDAFEGKLGEFIDGKEVFQTNHEN